MWLKTPRRIGEDSADLSPTLAGKPDRTATGVQSARGLIPALGNRGCAMPSPELILSGLTALATEWRGLAIAWHMYFAALLLAALARRLPRRVLGALLVIPVLSVGALAWSVGNWFNGAVFGVLAVLLAGSARRMSIRTARPASLSVAVPGALLLAFGFGYPHFLEAKSWLPYAYSAPLGVLPCPTLSALLGVTLIFGLFRQGAWALILGVAALLYGAIGTFRLGVGIDVVLIAGSAVLVVVAISAGRSVRAHQREHLARLPGDELIARPIDTLTHAITIHRPRHDVWPWIAQMGAGRRAGWYSYDFLDNGRRPSASRIVPELQHLERGMIFPALPKVTDGFTLLSFEPDRSLVLGWGPPGRPDVTWAFQLDEAGPGATRLVVRAAGGPGYRFHGLPVWLTKVVVRIVHFVMERKQLLGIARRVEMQAS